jgi:hypothetical protein
MPDTKPATASVEVLGKVMDELARQIGAMNPDGRKRKVLIDEISDLGHIRVWLRTETSRAILEKADELARELARLKIGDRHRIEIVKKFCILCRQ